MACRSLRLAVRCFKLSSSGQISLIRHYCAINATRSAPASVARTASQLIHFSTATNGPKLEIINAQDDAQFKELVIDSKDTVVVDFHASWCAPCKLLAPRLEKVMEQVGKPVKLVKVDIDNEDLRNMVDRYMISAVPTVLGMRNGIKINEFKGLLEEDRIAAFLDQLTA